MPDRKKKGKGKKKRKTPRVIEVIPEEVVPTITEEPEWHPSEPPPSDYELLSITPSMQNVRAYVDVVLDHLTKDENIKNYSSEFVRLYESTSIAHLEKRDCYRKIDRQRTKLEEQEKLVTELTTTVNSQQEDIKKKNDALAALLAETSYRRAREVTTVELIGSLRNEITRLRKWETHRTGGSEEDVEDFKIKNRLAAQKATLQEELDIYKVRLADTYKALDEVGKEEAAAREIAAALEEKLQSAQQDLRLDIAKRTMAEEELQEEKDSNEGNKIQIKNLSELLQSAGDTISSLKSDVIERKTAYNSLQKEKDALNQHLEDLSRKHNRLLEKVNKIQNDVDKKTRHLADVNRQLSLNITLSKRLEGKVRIAQNSLREERARNEKTFQEKQILMAEQRKQDQSLRECQAKIRDSEMGAKQLKVRNDTLKTKLAKSEYALTQMTENNLMLTKLKRRLNADYKSALDEKVKLAKEIRSITGQKQKCSNEVALLALQVQLKDEEVSNKLKEIAICKKELREYEAQLQAQVNAYESLMFRKNALANSLLERDSRIETAKSDLKLASKCIDQLKENVSLQDSKINALTHALGRAASLRDELSVKINRAKETEKKLCEELEKMRLKEKHYVNEIKILEKERDMIQRRFNDVESDRNIIGTQLVRKNDEIQLLRVANENFRKESERGQIQYSERLDDIRLLRSEIANMRRKVQILSNGPSAMDLRKELYNTQKELTKEVLKRTALEEECCNVLNIHKWRKLESIDPGRLELVRKVSLLQERLLKQQEKQLLNEEKLQASDKLFAVLRETLDYVPAQDPPDTRRLLAKKESSIKALIAEARANVIERKLQNEAISQFKQDADIYRNLFFSAKRVLRSNGLTLRGKA